VTFGAIGGVRPGRLSALLSLAVFAGAVLFASNVAAEPLKLEVAHAILAFDRRTGEPVVSFTLTESSRRLFADFTAQNVGRKGAILVDGRVVTKPVIREPILGGAGQISGGFSVDEAKDIADRLSSGAARMEVEAVAD
jgi:preprotein translocase subunit SecD